MGTITCPHCWQNIDFDTPDYDTVSVRLVIDCEVCCRPIVVNVHWDESGEDPMINVEAE